MDTNASGIYQILNTVTGKVYVGSAVKISARWREHLRRLRSGARCNDKLLKAWIKYGEGSFVFSILEVVELKTDLLAREQHWIDTLNAASRDNYNIAPIADSSLGITVALSTREKMRAAWRRRAELGLKRSPEAIRKTALAHTGMKRSPQTRARISAAARGRKQSPESIAKRLAKTKGQKRTAEQNMKLSAALRGIRRSPEARANMSAGMKGRVAHNKGKRASPERRAQMSVTAKLREQRKRDLLGAVVLVDGLVRK